MRGLALLAVDLVEDAAVLKMDFMRCGPPAKDFVDGEELHLRELRLVFVLGLRIARPVVMFAGDILAFRRVEVVEVPLGDLACATLVDDLIDDSHGRFSENGNRRRHDLEFVSAEFLGSEIGLVFPGNQHVADAAFGKGCERATRATVENFGVFIDSRNEVFRLFLVAAIRLERLAPGGEVVPARAAGRLGVWRYDFDAVLAEIGPILDALGVALANQEHDR